MDIEKLLLTKEELPILYETCFIIPIHPKMLDPSIRLDLRVAQQVFSQVAVEWYGELNKYVETLASEQTKSWIKEVFLNKKPRVKRESGKQVLNTAYWRDDVGTGQNGFAHSLCISRNSGGSLYFSQDRSNVESISLDGDDEYIKFSKEKIREFAFEVREDLNIAKLNIYGQHNIDSYPGALFLRNWAIDYINGIFVRHHELFVR